MTYHRCAYKVICKSRIIQILAALYAITVLFTILKGKFSHHSNHTKSISHGDLSAPNVMDHRPEKKHDDSRFREAQNRGGGWKNETVAQIRELGGLHNDRAAEGSLRNNTWLPFHNTKIAYNPSKPPQEFLDWRHSQTKLCDGKFIGYFNKFAQLRDVTLDKEFCTGQKGGEDIAEVLLQSEDAEFYTYDKGFIKMECASRPVYEFDRKNHLNELMPSLQTVKRSDVDVQQSITEGFHLLVTRYEYANIYHTMTDWYNAFLLMNFFNKTPAETNILIVDGHPKGALDSVWSVLFNSSQRISQLKTRTLYKELTFNIIGYDSFIQKNSEWAIPLIEEFSQFVLNSYRLPYNDKHLDCARLSVLFVWRRDYINHPRNPKGKISRKIKNERELVELLQKKYPKFDVKGVQIDLFDMQQQLEYVSQSDVLIGMHGAALTHCFFLPKHAGMIELYPNYFSSKGHFRKIAYWRNLKFESWINRDEANEAANQHTIIPTDVIVERLHSLLRKMGCR